MLRTFNQEQDLPAFDVRGVDMEDAICKKTRECPTQGSGRVVDGHPLAHLVSLVESRHCLDQYMQDTSSFCSTHGR